MPGVLIIRADASTKIGTGHVMRCLALSQAWQDDKGDVVFVMATESSALETRLKSEGIEIVHLSVQPGSPDDAIQTTELARNRNASWVVIDGYHFDAVYQKNFKDAGLKILFIDDYGHAEHYFADIVLNQNLHASEDLYVHREPYTFLLLGPRYVLLRKEFLKWRGWKREIPEVGGNVLVTMGGGDPDNVTLKVIQALNQMDSPELKVKVVVGPSNRHVKELQSAIPARHRPPEADSGEAGGRNPQSAIHILQNVTNMPSLMACADIAISAGGTTAWELAFMGVPNLVMVVADNQYPVAEQLHKIGAAVCLGWYEDISTAKIQKQLIKLITTPTARMQMAHKAQELVDGMGAPRALIHMNGKNIRLRPVREDDCRLLWEWVSGPDVRAVSFLSEPIPWDEHVKWFNLKLTDPHCIFYISINGEGIPVGQIRFDSEGNEAVVSVSVAPKFRGKGYGSSMIWLATQRIFDVSNITVIYAHVKKGNDSSVRAFEKAGFRVASMEEISGCQAKHLVLQK